MQILKGITLHLKKKIPHLYIVCCLSPKGRGRRGRNPVIGRTVTGDKMENILQPLLKITLYAQPENAS